MSAFIARLAKLAYRAPVDAKVIGASASGPIFEPARAGVTVDTAAMLLARRAIGVILADLAAAADATAGAVNPSPAAITAVAITAVIFRIADPP